ncbi:MULTISPECIES: hypothetical protein [Paenarthrobacter]|uniref:Uncharacterized protein n=1 Tax=Paenarthrobacter ureafaciens TaxID=37931 RepID=A0AAX3EK81_PAEUR|nr:MULTISPECIES: hypothetical protein [Paenarthrobacter]NKR12473.1 hypothetical protein [Arthrobacter sp. M5]NKR14304.1 hypothetical protein [Arthrobacter sp. M6]OEH61257.1 hypothetical protein A5N17_14145 [Arthrobacter sp. D2]OEH64312.1 hypothetical protein A5N13_13045 [Arthrobacter sp. D4]MDO5863402.1 hypothetical protein [Paenarthrobacter sp. SD-2]
MGLLDNAAEFQQAQREAKDRQLAKKDEEFSPWTSPWTMELRDLLVERGARTRPLYAQRLLTELVAAPELGQYKWRSLAHVEYRGNGWLLRGWQYDDGLSQVDLLLTKDAALWKAGVVFEKSLTAIKGGYAEVANYSHFIYYPNVEPAHRSSFTLLSDYRLRRAPTYPGDDDVLRALIGVPIAAAVLAGGSQDDGWIVAEEPDIADTRFYQHYY